MTHRQSEVFLVIKKLILSCIILLSAVLMLGQYSNAKEKEENELRMGGFIYSYEITAEGFVQIVKVTPLVGYNISNLEIPSEIEGKRVERIGIDSDFFYEDMSEDYSLFGIHSSDFDGSLYPRELVDTVSEIKSITIPETVKWISPNAFQYIQDGKNLSIPSKLQINMLSLSRIRWKNVSILKGNNDYCMIKNIVLTKDKKTAVTNLGKSKNVTIPNGVETIDAYAFYYGNVKNITIPKSVKCIKEYALQNSNIKSIKLSKNNKVYKYKDGCVYNKKTGEAIAVIAKKGVVKFPKEVRILKNVAFIGKVKKIIFSKKLKKVYKQWYKYLNEKKVTLKFLASNPPSKIGNVSDSFFPVGKLVFPKGAKKKYLKTGMFE